MNSYFFVPATKLKKLESLQKLGVEEFIIDFEDAIKASQRESLFAEMKSYKDIKKHFVRVPLHNLIEQDTLDLSFVNLFIKEGYKKFVFPKLASTNQLDEVLREFEGENLEVILLIENPRLYLELPLKLEKYKKIISGLGLGSHDYMSVIQGKHNLKNLEVLRQNILYMARAYDMTAIDIASMEIKNQDNFVEELIDGFDKGYDDKFIIHPKQFEIINETQFYTQEEYEYALKIEKEISKLNNTKEFNPIILEGKIIEQPHINLAKKIIKSYSK